MMTVKEMIEMKDSCGITIAQIAERSGVPTGTLGKIFSGSTKKPRMATMQALERVFMSEEFRRSGKAARYDDAVTNYYEILNEDGKGCFYVRESSPAYGNEDYDFTVRYTAADVQGTSARWPKQGEYTIEDYLALPDDVRVELIDGAFFYMEGPVSIHQAIVSELTIMLGIYVKKTKGSCRVFPSPIDVQLDNDDRTMVQPDVVVVCDKEKIRRRIHGAPDLVIEILSPSSRSKDRRIKQRKYADSGVREYWIIDPYEKKVVVYDFMHDDDVSIYGFEEKVPVLIWEGKCEIDFSEIYEEIKDLYFEDPEEE